MLALTCLNIFGIQNIIIIVDFIHSSFDNNLVTFDTNNGCTAEGNGAFFTSNVDFMDFMEALASPTAMARHCILTRQQKSCFCSFLQQLVIEVEPFYCSEHPKSP